MAHLLPLVLGHVGLQLEVGAELSGAELALVGAVDEDYLLCLDLGLVLGFHGLGPSLGLAVLLVLPMAAISFRLGVTLPVFGLSWNL